LHLQQKPNFAFVCRISDGDTFARARNSAFFWRTNRFAVTRSPEHLQLFVTAG
jgi:hypothetical protein